MFDCVRVLFMKSVYRMLGIQGPELKVEEPVKNEPVPVVPVAPKAMTKEEIHSSEGIVMADDWDRKVVRNHIVNVVDFRSPIAILRLEKEKWNEFFIVAIYAGCNAGHIVGHKMFDQHEAELFYADVLDRLRYCKSINTVRELFKKER